MIPVDRQAQLEQWAIPILAEHMELLEHSKTVAQVDLAQTGDLRVINTENPAVLGPLPVPTAAVNTGTA